MSNYYHQGYCGAFRFVDKDQAVYNGNGVLLVGEDNPHSSKGEHALYPHPPGCAGHRLQSRILGLDAVTYMATWRTNLICWDGSSPSKWSVPVALDKMRMLLTGAFVPWRTVVLLGAKVAQCARRVTNINLSPFDWAPTWSETSRGRFWEGVPEDRVIKMVYLPHPSGRSRVWNDQSAVVRARALLREVAPGVPWGELDEAGGARAEGV